MNTHIIRPVTGELLVTIVRHETVSNNYNRNNELRYFFPQNDRHNTDLSALSTKYRRVTTKERYSFKS